MTFFGYNASDVAKKISREESIFDKSVKEIKEGKAKLIILEEFVAELGISDERSCNNLLLAESK
ncbi:MAG: hypothetical protein M1409_10060 [Actinobacteria bacterium]|nr:hypothetical protein [Actinomycetota bacterium]